MNKKNIIYAAIAILIVAGAAGIVIWRVGQRAEQPVPQEEEQVPADSFDTDTSIESGELGEYGKLLNEMEFENLDEEFKEIDGLINQL
jgi:Flp pilus assembly protein CpaB